MARKKRRRGEGSQLELPSGSWRAEVPLGHGDRVQRTFPTEREATKWRVATCAARDAGTFAKPTAETVNIWLDRWLAQKAGKTEPATHAFYTVKAQRHVRPHLGTLKLSALTPAKVEDWYAAMTRAGVSASEQRRAGRTLRTAVEDAVRQQVVPVNHAKAVKMPRSRPAEATALDLAQARRLIAAAGLTKWGPLVRLALDSGVRPQELFAIRRIDLPDPCDVLNVRRAVQWVTGKPPREKEPKTAKGRGRAGFAAATAEALRGLPPGPPNGLLFAGKTGKWLNLRAFNDGSMQKLCKAAEIPYVPVKVLRHTSATLLLQAGANLKAVSERLGHEDPAMTLRVYQHVMPSMQEAVRDISQSLFG